MQRLMVLLLLQPGLHFSREVMKSRANGVDMAEVTLHTGLGTFRSIEVEDLSNIMDAEFYMNNQAVETIICA